MSDAPKLKQCPACNFAHDVRDEIKDLLAERDAEIAKLRSENQRLHEEAQLWFKPDGTTMVLPVGEVVERRKEAAKKGAEMSAEIAKLREELRAANEDWQAAVDRCMADNARLRTTIDVLCEMRGRKEASDG